MILNKYYCSILTILIDQKNFEVQLGNEFHGKLQNESCNRGRLPRENFKTQKMSCNLC